MDGSERRTTQRIPAKFEINYIHDGDYLISYTKDISADGMFIHTSKGPAIGETINLTFALGDFENISVDAKVVWQNKSDSIKDAGMGVKFVNPPEELKDAVLTIVKRIAIIEEDDISA